MTQFATADDLATYLRVGDPDEEWTAQANLLLELISVDMQSAAGGQTIETGSGTHKLAGTWDRDLELPQRPVTAITSVSVNGVAVASSAYTWNARQLIRRGALSYADDFDPEFDWHSLGFQGAGWLGGSHWGGPDSTVVVAYAWGLAAEARAMAMLRSMALRVAGRTIENPQGVTSEQLGAYSVQYGRAAAAGSSHLNTAEVRALRKRFGRTGGTFIPQGAIG